MRVAKYLRLSNEDLFNKDESSSIVNQRLLIDSYIQRSEELVGCEAEEFIDDGFTGTNMERPGVASLLTEVKSGNINCIIVKDFSRFTRDYLELGRYLEKIFPFMNVRFISVNDNYDSKDTVGGIGEIDNSFKALLNDFYSKDVSEKVLSNYRVQTKLGKAILWAPPYGYMKDPDNKHKFLIDEIAAKTVRKIYQLVLDDLSLHKIARKLSEDGDITPAERKKMLTNMDYSYMHKKGQTKKYRWNISTLSRITTNREYLGYLVKGMTTRKEVGSRKRSYVDEEDWIIVEDHHEPIITKEAFDRVQEIKKTRQGTYPKGNAIDSTIKGLVTCKYCGHVMQFLKLSKPTKEYYYIKCRWGRLHSLDCKELNYNMKDIEDLVLKSIQLQFNLGVEQSKLQSTYDDVARENNAIRSDKLNKLSRDHEQIKKLKRGDYEKYKFNKLSKEEYFKRKKLLDKQLEELDIKIKDIKSEDIELLNSQNVIRKGMFIHEKYIGINRLTDELINDTIEEIILGDNNEIEIKFKTSAQAPEIN